MKIGIACYPTHGGSGVLATELGISLAKRGHEIHFISYSLPFRLNEFHENIFFHEVDVSAYPLFKYPPYALSLATRLANVVIERDLDIIHAHYAVPHAVSGYLARKMLGNKSHFKIITTLHGTDVTLVGADPTFQPIVKFSIEESDGVTAVSNYLKRKTIEEFEIEHDIRVIYNFVDTSRFDRSKTCCERHHYAEDHEKILIHVSNFRPVKRVSDVVRIFDRIHKKIPSKLVLVGEGPERIFIRQLAKELKLLDSIHFLCQQEYVENLYAYADLLLLPSEQESFGLAALEAMSCGVPVIGTQTGGLPEVVVHGETGFLAPIGEIGSMTRMALRVLTDDGLRTRLGENAKLRARKNFDMDLIVSQYERFYEEISVR
ncbi:N-acetyl-alpha-D-glucosaminyl L-malate synthase BshA [candidate division KSB1 bacterium]|nr:N-acetyl-alpha-D-glucosaminyl L-malate synthase BshA [candidate division KSB1 bacterium]